MVLFVVAGVALIALLLALHMTVAAGTLNGLILYANIVNVHRDIFPPGQPGVWAQPTQCFHLLAEPGLWDSNMFL